MARLTFQSVTSDAGGQQDTRRQIRQAWAFHTRVCEPTNLIARLTDLVVSDEDARAFVRRWRTLVETASPDEYPQCRGAIFASTEDVTWTIGAQLLTVVEG